MFPMLLNPSVEDGLKLLTLISPPAVGIDGVPTLTRLICPPGADSVPPVIVTPGGTLTFGLSGSGNVPFPPTSERVWPSGTVRVLPFTVMAAGFELKNPKAETGAL